MSVLHTESRVRGCVAGRALVVVVAVVGLLAAVLAPAVQAQEVQENEPPTAVVYTLAGTAVNSGDEVTLDGSLSFDPEGSELRYEWVPERSFLWLPLSGGGTEPTVTFFVPDRRYVRPDDRGVRSFEVTLTVTDDRGASSSRRVRFTLNPGPNFKDITLQFPVLAYAFVVETIPVPQDVRFMQPYITRAERVFGTDFGGDFVFGDSFLTDPALEPHRRLEVRVQNPGVSPVQVYPNLFAPNIRGELVYEVDEGDTVRLRVQADEPGVTYEWEQVFGEGTPLRLVANGPVVTFVAPKVIKTDPRTGSVERQVEDVVVMVTATDVDGGSNFLRFELVVQEVDESPRADAGRNQEGALPLDVMPTELQALSDAAAEKIGVRLDASDTTDPDPYDVPVAVADDPATIGVDEARARTVGYEWRVVELETADGISSEDGPLKDQDDERVRDQLRALKDDFRFEQEDAAGVRSRVLARPAPPAPPTPPDRPDPPAAPDPPTPLDQVDLPDLPDGYFVNPAEYDDAGTTVDIASEAYLDLLKDDLTADITALQAGCSGADDAAFCGSDSDRTAVSEEGRRRLYALADDNWFTGTPATVADAVAASSFTIYDSHQLYPRCFAGTTGCFTAEDDDVTGFREADPEGEGLTPRVLSYQDAVLESLEAQYRRAVIYQDRDGSRDGYREGYAELLASFEPNPAYANDLFVQRIILTDATPFTAYIDTRAVNSGSLAERSLFRLQVAWWASNTRGSFMRVLGLLACILDVTVTAHFSQVPGSRAGCYSKLPGVGTPFNVWGDSPQLANLLDGRWLGNDSDVAVPLDSLPEFDSAEDTDPAGIADIPLDRLLAVFRETIPGLRGLADAELARLVSGWGETQIAILADSMFVPAGTHLVDDVIFWDDARWEVQDVFARPGWLARPDWVNEESAIASGWGVRMERPVDRSLYHRLLPRDPNTRVAVDASPAQGDIQPRAVATFAEPTGDPDPPDIPAPPAPPDASIRYYLPHRTGASDTLDIPDTPSTPTTPSTPDSVVPSGPPVVFLIMPAACDTDGDGDCDTGEAPREHPLLGGRVVVEVSARSDGGAPAGVGLVEIDVSEDPNQRPEVEADVRNNVGRLVSEVQAFEGEPVVLSGLQSDDDNENDPDFDGLTYIWTQVRPTPETADGDSVDLRDRDPSNDVCVNCVFGSDSGGVRTTTQAESEVVFSGDVTGLQPTPQGRNPHRARFEFTLRVRDQYGVSSDTSERVRVVVVEANEPPVVDAGDDQQVDAGEPVTLTAAVSDPDLAPEGSDESHTIAWTQTAGPAVDLDDARSESVSFTADAGAEGATLEFTVTVTDSRGLSATDTVVVTVGEGAGEDDEPGPDFYTGTITGPEFCTNMSLGGPRTFAFDSDGDGVADVCSLRTTREVAIERQNALEAQAADNRDRFLELVLAACAEVPAWVPGDPGDVCATEILGVAPTPLSVEEAPVLYSGIITGPDFCTDLSLGGPRTFAFDSNGDGIANICSLPWSRREAVARQNALEALNAELNA